MSLTAVPMVIYSFVSLATQYISLKQASNPQALASGGRAIPFS